MLCSVHEFSCTKIWNVISYALFLQITPSYNLQRFKIDEQFLWTYHLLRTLLHEMLLHMRFKQGRVTWPHELLYCAVYLLSHGLNILPPPPFLSTYKTMFYRGTNTKDQTKGSKARCCYLSYYGYLLVS
jgi:hypothetical protein